eukprot:scaffold2679_cov251-Pinguiococcus_pyrenoidosus.AAC.27
MRYRVSLPVSKQRFCSLRRTSTVQGIASGSRQSILPSGGEYSRLRPAWRTSSSSSRSAARPCVCRTTASSSSCAPTASCPARQMRSATRPARTAAEISRTRASWRAGRLSLLPAAEACAAGISDRAGAAERASRTSEGGSNGTGKKKAGKVERSRALLCAPEALLMRLGVHFYGAKVNPFGVDSCNRSAPASIGPSD